MDHDCWNDCASLFTPKRILGNVGRPRSGQLSAIRLLTEDGLSAVHVSDGCRTASDKSRSGKLRPLAANWLAPGPFHADIVAQSPFVRNGSTMTEAGGKRTLAFVGDQLPMEDARQFNIRDADGRLLCPACGFPSFANETPYDERGGLSGAAICPCCLWEPGFDDTPGGSADAEDTILASLRNYRAKWTSDFQWRGRGRNEPPDWDAERQLAHLFEVAPNVR